MKDFKQLLNKKKLHSRPALDEKSILYVFQAFVKEEYGRQGVENLRPISYHKGMLLLGINRDFWKEEISFNKATIISKLNQQLGSEEIKDLNILN